MSHEPDRLGLSALVEDALTDAGWAVTGPGEVQPWHLAFALLLRPAVRNKVGKSAGLPKQKTLRGALLAQDSFPTIAETAPRGWLRKLRDRTPLQTAVFLPWQVRVVTYHPLITECAQSVLPESQGDQGASLLSCLVSHDKETRDALQNEGIDVEALLRRLQANST